MPDSEALKDFKAVWGESCHSMWVELLCISATEHQIYAEYRNIPPSAPLSDLYHAPDVKGRIQSLNKDVFITKSQGYRRSIVANRVVILSASFEAYFGAFLDGYISSRDKLFDSAASKKTSAGDKLAGEVLKCRGLVSRIRKFAELAPAKIKSIEPLLTYVNDVYILRNILAHRAGVIDSYAASTLTNISFKEGETVVLAPGQLLALAAPLVKTAEHLDRKMISEYNPATGKHRSA